MTMAAGGAARSAAPALVALALLGCARSTSGPFDAAVDARTDAGLDASPHEPLDGGRDAGPPAARDAGADAASVACATCDDGIACTTDTCFAGECVHTVADDGAPCGDGLECARGLCALRIAPPPDLSGWEVISYRLIGDFDGDGLAELVVLYKFFMDTTGHLIAYSGRTGAMLWRLTETFSAVSMEWPTIWRGADLNGDSAIDFAVDDTGFAGRTGRVWLRSGVDGHVLFEIQGARPFLDFGYRVQLGPDASGDAVPDVLIVGPQASGTMFPHGQVGLYSGLDGAPIVEWDMPYYFWPSYTLVRTPAGVPLVATFDGARTSLAVGPPAGAPTFTAALTRMATHINVPAGSDYDSDGYDDLVVCTRELGSVPLSSCDVVSTRTGATLLPYPGQLGLGDDVDGDGRDDAVGAPVEGAAELMTVPDGRVLCRWSAFDGRWAYLGPDADGDGIGDVVTREPGTIDRVDVLLSTISWGGCEP